MSDSFDFEEYRKIELKIRDLTKKILTLEKERDELKRKKAMEKYLNYEDY